MFWIQGSFIFLIQFYLHGAYTADPCTYYSPITHKLFTVAFTAHNVNSSLCQNTASVTVLYSYTVMTRGRITNKCPQDLQCGSKNQIWFNDTIPTVADGEVRKLICTHEGLDCCAQSNQFPTKNCTDFTVYQLAPGFLDCYNYCYEAPSSEGGNAGSKNNTASILVWLMIALVVVLRCVDV